MTKIFAPLILIIALFSSFHFAQAQSACPTGYYQEDDICCSSAAEAPPTGSYAGKAFCFKRKALAPEKVCQKVPGTTPGIWCKQSDVCGYGTYHVPLLGDYEFDLCITPPPPGPTINIGSIRDDLTNTWTAIFCNANTEEAGPAGVPYNAFYCQPKKVNGQIVAPADRKSCTSGTGTKYSGENWCCPEGQEALVQARGTPYCAILPIKLSVISPTANQTVSSVVPIKVKLVLEQGRSGVGKFKQLSVAIKSVSTGVFLTPPAPLTFDSGVPDNGNQGSPRTYTFNWNTQGLRGGNYLIYVSATDDFDNTTNAEPYSITVNISENSVKSLTFFSPKNGATVRGLVPVVLALDGTIYSGTGMLVTLEGYDGQVMAQFSDSHGLATPVGVPLPKSSAYEASRLRYYSFDWDTQNGRFAVPNGWHGLSVKAINTDRQEVSGEHIGVLVDNPVAAEDTAGPAITRLLPASNTLPPVSPTDFIPLSFRADDPSGLSLLRMAAGSHRQDCSPSNPVCSWLVPSSWLPVGSILSFFATDNSPRHNSSLRAYIIGNGSMTETTAGDKLISARSAVCSPVAVAHSSGLLPTSLSGLDQNTLKQILGSNDTNQSDCPPNLPVNPAPASPAPAPAASPSSPTLDIGAIIFQIILKILGRGII